MTNPDDHNSLAGDIDETPEATDGLAATTGEEPDTPLDLDELIAHGTLPEAVAHIYLDGAKFAEYEEVIAELKKIVDEDGEVLSDGEQALTDGVRATQLAHRAHQLEDELRRSRRSIRFVAMPSDEWVLFDAKYRPGGKFKDAKAANEYHHRLIARCAINPTIDIAGAEKMQKKLGAAQWNTVANTAFFTNTRGGVDIPKSPASSLVETRRTSVES